MTTTLHLGDRVTLHYRLTCQDEILVDTFAAGPETFTLGHGDIDARLESLLLGLSAGDHRLFDLGPGEAFGSHDPAMIHTLPREDFPPEMALEVQGGVMFDLPNGQSVNGTVLELLPDHVRVDFNHPLAGYPVEFEVQILAIDKTH